MSSVSSNQDWKSCRSCGAEYLDAVCGYCGAKPKEEPRLPTEVTDEEFDEMGPEND